MTPPSAAQGGALQAPGLRRRVACLIYEGLLLFGVGLLSGAIGTAALKVTGAPPDSHDLVLQLVGVLVYGMYFVWFWSRRGQTLPMQTWNIKVVTKQGERLSTTRALLRYLACSVWVAPAVVLSHLNDWSPRDTLVAVCVGIAVYALLAFLQPQRQFWHDVLCGTRLVNAPPPAKPTVVI